MATENKEWSRYQFKLYDLNDNFIKVIQNDTILSDVSFTKSINSWIWEITVDVLWRAELDTIFDWMIKLKVYEKDPETNTFYQIFWWLINNIENLYESYDYYRIYWYWYITLFSEKILKDWLNYTFEKEMEAWAMLKYVIDEINVDFNNLLSYWSIPNTWKTIKIKFDKTNWLDAINEIIKQLDWYYYYVNINWSVDLKVKSNTYDKILIKWRDLYDFYQWRDLNIVKNHYIVEHFLWLYESEDITSISKWWRRTETIIDKEIPDEIAAIAQVQKYLNKTAHPIKKTKAVINTQYIKDNTFLQKWITLEPWMTCNIRNIDDENISQNIQIYKMTYSKDNIEIEFEDITSLSKSISEMIIDQKKKIIKSVDDKEWTLNDWFVEHFLDDSELTLTNTVVWWSQLSLAIENYNNPATFSVYNITTIDWVIWDFASYSNLKFVDNIFYLDFTTKAYDFRFSY